MVPNDLDMLRDKLPKPNYDDDAYQPDFDESESDIPVTL